VPKILSVPRGDVALTIDDGPSPYTEQIIQVLNRYHVHANFFFIGNRVPLWPNEVGDVYAFGDRDPRDWADRNPQQLVNSVVNGNPSSGVFDLHDKRVTLETLPTIIEKLRARGLHFVALGQTLQ
jgi:peptidoglycan/xylan/chitin deacetylase (PgdA/CDA1 family)